MDVLLHVMKCFTYFRHDVAHGGGGVGLCFSSEQTVGSVQTNPLRSSQ